MTLRLLLSVFSGTVAFAIIFNIPSRHFLPAGLIGVCGWFIYSLLISFSFSTHFSVFIATLFIALLSRYGAVIFKAPDTIFLISGIIPLVPGAGIYWTAYYLVANNLSQAQTEGAEALRISMAIALGIVIIHELPQRMFSGKKRLN